MRTRRSPRNQEILWRALGEVEPPAKGDSTSPEAIQRMLDTCLNARTRKQLERDLVRARQKAAVKRALDKE